MSRSTANPAYRAFIQALVASRRGAGVTQAQLANRLNRPQSFISKVERLERRLDVVEFCDMARAMGWSPAELLGLIDTQVRAGLRDQG